MTDRSQFDPFAPSVDLPFRRERWVRAGATPDELDLLTQAANGTELPAVEAEARAIDAVADGDLSEALDRQRQSGDWCGFTGLLSPPVVSEKDPAGMVEAPPSDPGPAVTDSESTVGLAQAERDLDEVLHPEET